MSTGAQVTLWEEDHGTVDARNGSFRPIHYLGSKLRLVDEICAAVDAVAPAPGRVCDLFAGSGTVAWALSRSRSVTAVDIQEYSRVLCSALLPGGPVSFQALQSVAAAADSGLSSALANAVEPMVEHETKCLRDALAGRPDLLCELLDQGSIFSFQQGLKQPTSSRRLLAALKASSSRLSAVGLDSGVGSLTTRYYGGVYFSYAQSVALDAMLTASDRVKPASRDSALAVTLSTASDVVNTVGKHFAQPLRLRKKDGTVKQHLLAKVAKDRGLGVAAISLEWAGRYASISPSPWPQRAISQDYAAFLEADTGDLTAIYADPPYTRDHYSRYYHILETMARRDVPEVSRSNLDRERPSRGLYRVERHQSPFCVKTRAPGAFQRLFELAAARRVPLVLSYSPFDKAAGAHPRLMTVDGIMALARQSYREADQFSVGRFTHSKLNSTEHALEASAEAEVLIVCRDPIRASR